MIGRVVRSPRPVTRRASSPSRGNPSRPRAPGRSRCASVVGRSTRRTYCSSRAAELAPRIEARYELADVQAAVCHAAREGRLGKILLISEDDA